MTFYYTDGNCKHEVALHDVTVHTKKGDSKINMILKHRNCSGVQLFAALQRSRDSAVLKILHKL